MSEAQRVAAERVARLERALARLDEVLAMRPQPDHPLADAAIQRFEFSIELCWRALQAVLALELIEARSPRAVLTAAYAQHWIEDEARWLRMVEDRNRTSHAYNREIAAAILARLPDHLEAMQVLLRTLRARLADP